MLKSVANSADDRQLRQFIRSLSGVPTDLLCAFVERAIDELDERSWDSDYEPNGDDEDDLAEDGYRGFPRLLAGGGLR